MHLHLLPGVDDGARTIEDSLAMARALLALGFTDAAPSPHNRQEYASKKPTDAVLASTRAALAAHNLSLALHPNAENFFLDPDLFDAASGGSPRRVGAAGAYFLVEAPYTATLPSLMDVIFRLKVKGVTPLIAHPERCLEFERPGRAKDVVAAGAVLQMDVAALTGRYGSTAKKLSREFLSAGLYGVAATDMHGPTGAEAWAGAAMEELRKRAGDAALKRLFSENPGRILRGEPIIT